MRTKKADDRRLDRLNVREDHARVADDVLVFGGT